MNKTSYIKIFGILFILIPIIALILSLYGPFSLIQKFKTVIFPIKGIDMESTVLEKLSKHIEKVYSGFNAYVIIPWENAEAILAQNGYYWNDDNIYVQAMDFAKKLKTERTKAIDS